MNRFQKVATGALVAVILLIFVGAIVRVTGSGLGCPDWPKCWGCLIPPTSVEQVQLDDKTYEKIRAKGERRGMPAELLTREKIKESFNPVHTWIEYINRLTSLPVGFLTLATFIMSFQHKRSRPKVFVLAFLCLLNVLVNAWLGMQVVYSGLKPGIITLHMSLAFLLITLQVYVAWRGTDSPWRLPLAEKIRPSQFWITIALISLVVIEGIMGSQIREMTDELARSHAGESRADWIGELEQSSLYLVHRSFSWLIVIVSLLWFVRSRKARAGVSHWLEKSVMGIVGTMMLLGIVLAHIGILPVVQVLHVGLTACLLALLVLAALASKERELPNSHG